MKTETRYVTLDVQSKITHRFDVFWIMWALFFGTCTLISASYNLTSTFGESILWFVLAIWVCIPKLKTAKYETDFVSFNPKANMAIDTREFTKLIAMATVLSGWVKKYNNITTTLTAEELAMQVAIAEMLTAMRDPKSVIKGLDSYGTSTETPTLTNMV